MKNKGLVMMGGWEESVCGKAVETNSGKDFLGLADRHKVYKYILHILEYFKYIYVRACNQKKKKILVDSAANSCCFLIDSPPDIL